MPDFAAEGLLKGTRGNRRKARLELLQHLYRQGVSLEELRRAVAEDRLAILPAERVLADQPKYTIEEVSRRAGLDVELLLEQRRAGGLPVPPPDEPALSDRDVEAATPPPAGARGGAAARGLDRGRARVRAGGAPGRRGRALAGGARRSSSPATPSTTLGLRLAEAARTLHPQTIADARCTCTSRTCASSSETTSSRRAASRREDRRHARGGGLLRRPRRLHDAGRGARGRRTWGGATRFSVLAAEVARRAGVADQDDRRRGRCSSRRSPSPLLEAR